MFVKFLQKLQQSADFWFLLVTSFVFFLLRLPSFFEPYWYGDEGVYEVLGFAMRHGRLLYQGIWDNKPPLLYLIYALFDGNQSLVRVLSFATGLGAIVCLFFIAKKLFVKRRSVYLTTGFFTLLFGLPLIEGNIANAENFMLPFIFAAVLLVTSVLEKNKQTILKLFWAGLLLGIAFLFKVVGVFDFAAMSIVVIVALLQKEWKIKQVVIYLVLLTSGFVLPFLATVAFFARNGILKTFIQSAFLSNVGYVNYGNQFVLPFIGYIPQGFLFVKLLVLFILILILFFNRKKFSLTSLLIIVWISFSLFNAFFSQRPYTHYVLVLLGPLSLLFGYFWETKRKIIYVSLLLFVIALVGKSFWFYGNTPFYYANFLGLLSGQETSSQYQSFFDRGVPRDYAVAQFLASSLRPGQTVFIWTNSPQIYYLAGLLPIGRYTVAYHMTANATTLAETITNLQKIKPTFVVILSNASSFPFPMTGYKLRLTIDEALIYEKIL